jgi:serine/threonine protein kinase
VSKRAAPEQKLRDRCGTPAYLAPEMVRNLGYDGRAVDVWGAGVVLYAMLYGNFPFNGSKPEELENNILSGHYPLPQDISDSARDLIARILNADPQKRLTIPTICGHAWMRDVDESSTFLR